MVKYDHNIGFHYNKRDLDRCGLFHDTGFITGEKYKGQVTLARDLKGKRFTLGVSPTKCGLQAQSGYFDPKFILLNDKYSDGFRRQQRGDDHVPIPWVRPPATKKHSTPGDYFGTFEKGCTAFSPLRRPGVLSEKNLKCFIINPGKKGGPGYANICLNKYPSHDSYKSKEVKEHYVAGTPFILNMHGRPYFEPNPYKPLKIEATYRKDIHSKDLSPVFHLRVPPGYFNKFTKWESEKPVKKALADKREFNHFNYVGHNRSYYTTSIVKNKLASACNAMTSKTMKPITYPLKT